jgi:hypothetical protein
MWRRQDAIKTNSQEDKEQIRAALLAAIEHRFWVALLDGFPSSTPGPTQPRPPLTEISARSASRLAPADVLINDW